MHVVFVSNSTGKAAAKVKAVLDAYAIRIGEVAWATPITEEALEDVKKALKHGISRHTSVACYRNNGVGAMDLAWQIGNRAAYDCYGRFAPETQRRKKEFPMFYRHAALLANIAGLGHDIGKVNGQYQAKIGNGCKPLDNQSDGIRHEWMSAWVFRQTTRNDTPFSEAILQWSKIPKDQETLDKWMPVGDGITNAEDAATLLIATHHHAFGYGNIKTKNSLRNPKNVISNDRHIKEISSDQRDRLITVPDLTKDTSWAILYKKLKHQIDRLRSVHRDDADYWHGVTMVARAALILADHAVSSQDVHEHPDHRKSGHYANTVKTPSGRVLNQDLLWHLTNVGTEAARNVGIFANPDLPALSRETVERILEPSEDGRFSWQDSAADAMPDGPALIFNVASTGSGKTRGNVKLACALRRNNAAVRISSAFNLRSLTLQTHDAYCGEIKLAMDSECACLVGDPVVREIHESLRDDYEDGEVAAGTQQNISGLDGLVIPEWLSREAERISSRNSDRAVILKKMIAAPVLVSTIDFLNAAGDMTCPNADHAHALLRLIHSDLILDELDSYDAESMVAVLRLVHIAAAFGRNVIISSATLSLALAEYAHRAYRAGLRAYRAGFAGSSVGHVCVVCDLLPTKVMSIDDDGFSETYSEYLTDMAAQSRRTTKLFRVADVGGSTDEFHRAVVDNAVKLHSEHGWELDGRKVSVGLVRVANVDTCMALARTLIEHPSFHVVTYHAREPLARRAFKEWHFDRILKRKGGNGNAALIDVMREHLTGLPEKSGKNAIFVVVATPVEEVGRDHDFDWSVIEPSSIHSIIQTAGRVNRHRRVEAEKANIAILNRCYRDLDGRERGGCVFFWPGNEIAIDGDKTTHESHRMEDLLGVQVGKEKPLDVRLMFGSERVAFARCDEDSIRIRLNAVIGRHMERNGGIAWFSKWFGAAYPLREGDANTIGAVLPGDFGKIKHLVYGHQLIKGRATWNWCETENQRKDIERPDRAWLSATINEVAKWVESKLQRGIQANDLSFRIPYNTEMNCVDWTGVTISVNSKR